MQLRYLLPPNATDGVLDRLLLKAILSVKSFIGIFSGNTVDLSGTGAGEGFSWTIKELLSIMGSSFFKKVPVISLLVGVSEFATSPPAHK